MKHNQKTVLSIILVIILASLLCIPASAMEASNQRVTYFEDGSYLVTTTVDETNIFSRASGTKSGYAEQDYYSSSDELLWTFRVHGTFTYNGTSARATDADYSYDIYDSSWSFKSGSASYSGATATAKGSFSHLLLPKSVSVSLTCSPNGTLS